MVDSQHDASPSRSLRRELSMVDLTMTAIGGLVGSGWLFSSMTAATIAGPGALLSWVIGGLAVILLGFTFAELAGMLPEAGGIIRYPLYSHGKFVGFLVGWAALISWAGVPAIEAEAVIQYSSSYVHGLYNATSGSLTGRGFLVASLLVIVFFLVNYMGVKIYARINTPITFIKFAAPTLTIVAFLIAGIHPGNFHQHGGFLPFGMGGVFAAISSGGIIFTYTGFRPMFDLAGEAKHPQRDLPRAFLLAMVVVGILYLLLQTVFIGGVSPSDLAKGWAKLSFSSPFANLAVALNLSWVAIILYGDAILSPFGTGLVYSAGVPRGLLAFSKMRYFPQSLLKITRKGTPGPAMYVAFFVAIFFLLPFPSWQKMVGILSSATLLTYMVGPISVSVLRKTAGELPRPFKLGGLRLWGPVGFVIGSLIFYWTGWPTDGWLMVMSLVGIVVYAIYFLRDPNRSWADVKSAIWLLAYMAFVAIMSKLGSFGGAKAIHAPWDDIIVAAVSIPFYYWAIASGRATEYLSEARQVSEETRSL